MRKKMASLIVMFLVVCASSAHSSSVEDDFMKEIFRYLAKNRNMNLIAYSGEKVAEIGRLYYIEEPEDVETLNQWSKGGKGLKLFLYKIGYDLSFHEEYRKEENYIVGEKYTDYLGAELHATLRKKGIDIKAFKKALKKAQIRFSVYRKLVPATIASDSVQPDKRTLITQFDKFGLGVGILMPFQELIVVNFQYNETSSKELEALLGVEILKTVKAKLSSSFVKTQDLTVGLPASATIAIKAFPVYFKVSDRPWWGRWW